jgi:lipid-A-disaccharide synthase
MKFFLVAGEPSGDRLGAALMAGLKRLAPGVAFAGVGGALMRAEGLASLFPMDEIAVMGIAEVLPRYFALKRRIAETAAAAVAAAPAALVTIDSPDFCLRVAGIARRQRPELRTIHYVAPSVWAWRPGRAARMARVIDHVLALLPFEPPYMTAAGMTCDFVGHPVVGEPRATPTEANAMRGAGPLVLALPGSRRTEIARLAPVIGTTLALLRPRFPNLRVAVPTLPQLLPQVRAAVRDWPVRPEIVTEAARRRAAFAAADAAVAASGTVSLELAANGCPMVIAYDMNPLSFRLMRAMARVDTVTLVNLVSETRTVPEFLGPDCRAARIAPALARLLSDPQARAAQLAAMRVTMARLGQGGEDPGLRAARSVLAALAGPGRAPAAGARAGAPAA